MYICVYIIAPSPETELERIAFTDDGLSREVGKRKAVS
jgi:hypothetical protein